MGFVTSALGLGGGAGGSGYANASGAPIVSPVTKEQADAQNQNVQDVLSRQNDFVAALNAQNGIGNQSNVFNQLQGVANGTGPNPAQAMLSNATGANIANQAAMMAGQRGASQNSGLIARQAAIQGGNIQQQAAGQGAALQANQSLGALNAMGNLATNQVANLSQAQNSSVQNNLGAQNNLLNSITGSNNANVAMQSNINNANAQLAGGMQGSQSNMFGNIMGALGQGMQMLGGSGGAGGDSLMSAGGAADAGDAGMSMMDSGTMLAAEGGEVRMAAGGDIGEALGDQIDPVKMPQSNVGNFLKSDNSALQASGQLMNQAAAPIPQAAPAKSSGGGGLPGMAMIGSTMAMGNKVTGKFMDSDIGKFAGKHFREYLKWYGGGTGQAELGAKALGVEDKGTVKGAMQGGNMGARVGGGYGAVIGAGIGAIAGHNMGSDEKLAQGGEVPALVSPGEKYLSPQAMKQVEQGANPLAVGETIPGKPKVGGAKNSYANDTVRKNLDEGGVVLPRSVTQSKDAQKKADAFVQAILAKHGRQLPKRK